MISKNEKGYYDYFNHRITFPIWDHFGAIVGFGSRVLTSKQQPKYLNSKESFLFNKRNLLYAFHHAKKSIREKDNIILVEGYMDAIALHQAGFSQTVAIMGIAISEQNAAEISRLTQNVYLALDSDDAGYKAMERVNQEFLKLGVIPKYLNFTPHNDPDDYVKAEGAQSFSRLMQEAITFLDNKLNELATEVSDDSTPEQKRRTLQKAFELLLPLGKNISATERIADFAHKIGLRTAPEAIVEQYLTNLKTPSKPQRSEQPPVDLAPPPSFQQDSGYLETPKRSLLSSEKTLIVNTLRYPQLFESLKIAEVLDFLSNNDVKQYINRASDIYFESDDGEFEKLLRAELDENKYSDTIVTIVMGEIFQKNSVNLEAKEQEKMIEGIMKNLKIDSLRQNRKSLIEKQLQAQNIEESENFLRDIQNIDREIENIKKHRGHS